MYYPSAPEGQVIYLFIHLLFFLTVFAVYLVFFPPFLKLQ